MDPIKEWDIRPATPLAEEIVDILCGKWVSPEQIANDIVALIQERAS